MSARMFRATGHTPGVERRSSVKVLGAGVALTALSASLALAGTCTAAAAPAVPAASTTVSGASLAWGLSGEQGGGAFFGGCNFLSAGTAGNTGSSRLWTQADRFYKPAVGNVAIQKPNAEGTYVAPSWETKCQGPNGAPVSPGSTTSLTGNRVVFSNGTGTVNSANGVARLSWNGSFTSAFYGGLTYWSAANPVLTVSGGTGTLTASVSGYGADMNDASQWVTIPARRITVATLHGVSVTSTGFTATPDYLGVAVTTPAGKTPQSAPTTGNGPYWGAFPQAFVDFQQLTGTASYWFSSGGSRDAAKPATPLTVGWTLPTPVAPTITEQPVAVTAASGSDAVFEVGVAGTPAPKVTWQVRPLNGAWAAVPGATGTTLTVTADPSLHRNTYRAVVSNTEGKVTSKAVVLKVVNPA